MEGAYYVHLIVLLLGPNNFSTDCIQEGVQIDRQHTHSHQSNPQQHWRETHHRHQLRRNVSLQTHAEGVVVALHNAAPMPQA